MSGRGLATGHALALATALALACAGCQRRSSNVEGTAPVASGNEVRLPAIRQERHTASGDARLDLEFIVDRIDMTVAERVYATLIATARPEATVTMPDLGASLAEGADPGPRTLGGFTIVSSDTTDTIDGSSRRTTLRVVLEPFLAGEKHIPSLEVRARDAGKGFSLRTEEVTINVRAVADKTASAQTPLEPARGPVALAAPTGRTSVCGAIVAGGAAAVAILAALGFVVARSGRKREVDPAVRVRSEFERVRAMLVVDPSQAGARAAVNDLRAALAEYLRDAVGVPADTRTGADLSMAIQRSVLLTPDQRTELGRVLEEMERSQFAPDAASGAGAERLVARCAAWVDRVHAGTTGGEA